MFIEIREPGTNKLLCRYDPERNLLEHQRRGVKTLTDLAQLRQTPPDTRPVERPERLAHPDRPSGVRGGVSDA